MGPWRNATIVGVLATLACAHPGALTPDAEGRILELEGQRRQAQLRGDWAAIQQLNAPDFTEIAGTGVIRTAAQNAEDMRSGRLRFDRVDYTDQQVKRYGDVALVSGVGHRSGSFDGTPFDQRFRYTRVYVRRDGDWRVVFAQNTRMEGAPR